MNHAKLARASAVVQQVVHGARSIAKTSLLGKDRLVDGITNERLAICRRCPSGHAVFGRKGKLKTCGKLLADSMQQGNRKPCGCILRFKARDAKEDCPMGHWPMLGAPLEENLDQPMEPASMKSIASNQTALPNARSDRFSNVDAPECDTEFEKGATGRNVRMLNVEHRRMRIQARRARILSEIQKTRRVMEPAAAKVRQVRVRSRPKSVPVIKDVQSPQISLYDFFDRVVVVNLDRRADRMEQLHRHLADIDWPFRSPERFRAIDGRVVRAPAWWRAGGGAWGCHQSHVQIIERALMDNVQSLLVLEDDVFFEEGLRDRLQAFLSMVPDDWQQIYLGGQHLFQRRQPPIKINRQVVRPFNVNRTHAFALHQRGMTTVYRWLTDYVKHAEHPNHHIDHRLGALHSTGEFKVYAPTKWLAGQFESHSNIKGKVMPSRLWNGHRLQDQSEPFVAVIGLHRSGSSCLAGVLHKLGVMMGNRLQGYEATGGYEASGLASLCEQAYPFPSTELKIESATLRQRLRKHIAHVQRSARAKGYAMAGGKYPHLCCMGNELIDICGAGLRVIHIERPLEESIASLKTRSQKSNGWLKVSDEACETVQRWLWESKQDFLNKVEHLAVNYSDLLADPAAVVDRISEYLGISPDAKRRSEAIDHVRPELRNHLLELKSSVGAQGGNANKNGFATTKNPSGQLPISGRTAHAE